MPIVSVSDARWFLTALDGARAGEVWPIEGTLTIGRQGEIEVADRRVSREQVRIRAGDSVQARASGRGSARTGRPWLSLPDRWQLPWFRRLPRDRWRRLRSGTVLDLTPQGDIPRSPTGSREARLIAARLDQRPTRDPVGRAQSGPTTSAAGGARFLLERRPQRRSPVPWLVGGALVLAALLIPVLMQGPTWRWGFLLLPVLLLSQVFRRKPRRLRPLRAPLAVLLSSHEGRAFHSEPHVPVRALRRDLAGTGWAVRSEAEAVWLAGYLAAWNDPEVLAVASPWVSTHGGGLHVRFGAAPPARDAVAVTWGECPQWALPLRLPRGCHATPRWAAQLGSTRDPLPDRYLLSDALLADAARPGLAVPLAHGEHGPIEVDLARAPHALVAGATGSGKSELLTSWLLLMAARIPPSALNYVLIDFKGGATSGTLAGLPHLADAATDLEPSGARRIVTSLRAVLRERERLLAAEGCRELTELAAPPPRLVIVVDEFRALADDVPDTLDQLVRLAAQGRSLGVHLILATQRPGGAVTADMRANIPLRIALRTTETADSLDLIGTEAASRLAAIPGRAILADGGHSPVQIAWTSAPEAEVAAIRQRWGSIPAKAPWLPALPERIESAEVEGGIAVVDEPENLRRTGYPLPQEPLLVIGAHGRGLSATARVCAAAASAAGERVWLIGVPGGIDPRQTRLALQAIQRAGAAGDRIVIDGVEDWAAAHDSLHGHGDADGVIERLLRSAARPVLLTRDASPRWGRGIGERIMLAGFDRATAALAGLDREAQPLVQSSIRGRAVIRGHAAQICWVEQSPPIETLPPLPMTAELAPRAGTIHLGHDGHGEVRISAGSLAVVGPRGSGRTEAARMIAAQLPAASVLENPASAGPIPDGPIIATTTPEGWAGGYLGVLGHLRAGAPLLVLRPDLCPRLTPELAPELEPGTPGYAVLVDSGQARALRLCRGGRRVSGG